MQVRRQIGRGWLSPNAHAQPSSIELCPLRRCSLRQPHFIAVLCVVLRATVLKQCGLSPFSCAAMNRILVNSLRRNGPGSVLIC